MSEAFEPLSVALVDDDDDLRTAMAQTLALAGIAAVPFGNAEAALARVGADWPGVVLSDVRMPRIDGIALFRMLRARDPEMPVVLVTGHADVPMAVDALKAGAWDFLTKPFDPDALVAAVRRALEARALQLDNRRLRALADAAGAHALIGRTPAIERLRASVAALADTDVPVCIAGETGTGKELVARLLHRGGRRAARPFVGVACAALPDAAIEPELIGADGRGRLADAAGGSLFLDDVDRASDALQARLAEVLEAGHVRGHPLDMRVIAAATVSLATLADAGIFSAALRFRLCGAELRIPPLHERREDVPLLFAHLLDTAAARLRRPVPSLTGAVRALLRDHDWPGNVRELSHVADRLVLGLEPDVPGIAANASLPERVGDYEARLLRDAFVAEGGDVVATIERLGIPRKTFYYKVNRYGIDLAALRQDLRRPSAD